MIDLRLIRKRSQAWHTLRGDRPAAVEQALPTFGRAGDRPVAVERAHPTFVSVGGRPVAVEQVLPTLVRWVPTGAPWKPRSLRATAA